MAKSKAKAKDDDDDLPEEIEDADVDEIEEAGADDAEDADVGDVEEAGADDVEDVGDVEDADVEDVDAVADVRAKADDEDEEPPASVDMRPKPPKPKLTKLTIALILLNWVAVPAFVFAAWMDYSARMEFAYRTVLNYVQMIGLPLREEEDNASLANETQPRNRQSREQLYSAFKARPKVNASIKDFAPVDEPIPFRLRPSDMDKTLLDDIFRGLPDPVPTLEDEIDRLKTDLPKRIADAADEVLKKQKDDVEKRAFVQKTLYPIIGDERWKAQSTKDAPTPLNTWEIDKLNDRVQKATGAELDDLVKDSVQRRIYWDILAPVNLFRPGDVSKMQVEKMGDLTVTIDDIKGFLIDRLNASIADTYDTKVYIGPAFAKGVKRDTVEKRHKIAFVLFTLSQIEKPGLNEKLIKKGVERAQTISGLYEFTNATIDFVKTVRILEDRLAQAIKDDRDGATVKPEKGPITRNDGFIDLYEAEIDRLVRLVSNLETAQKRLKDLNVRKDEVTKTHVQRAKHFDKTLDTLLKERAKTAKYMKELRELQYQLHEALIELSDAAATNLRILDEITVIESEYIRKNAPKGGKK
jgi:hypothetical protein